MRDSNPSGRWDLHRGKWKLNQVIKDYLKVTPDPVTVYTLIRYLKSQGYHPTDTRRVLAQFVEINEKDHVVMKSGG